MRGAFTAEHVLLSSASLLASIVGLCAIMLVRVIVQGFAAVQDTKTPVRCSVIAIISNIIFNLILVWPLDYVGLALSTGLAAFVNLSLLIYFLKKRNIYTISKSTLLFILKALGAGVVMAVSVRYAIPDFESWVNMSTVEAALFLSLYIGGGSLVYLIACYILGIRASSIRM